MELLYGQAQQGGGLAAFLPFILIMFIIYFLMIRPQTKRQKEKQKMREDLQKGNKIAFITIEDDGPGIPEDQYRNVFKPFFRLDKSRSLNQSGVGLGLAIVEDIINSHGGNVQLGKSKFNGLQVKISLPF